MEILNPKGHLKLHYWFKSYGNFDEWVDFACRVALGRVFAHPAKGLVSCVIQHTLNFVALDCLSQENVYLKVIVRKC